MSPPLDKIKLGSGITISDGITLGTGSPGPAPVPGVNNVTGYLEMGPPVVPGTQLQDPTATVNGSVGFTINNAGFTGVAIINCTVSNETWFNANYLTIPGTYTCTWGPGSTVPSSSIQVVQLSAGFGNPLVFFIQGQTGPATYNYPFTFS